MITMDTKDTKKMKKIMLFPFLAVGHVSPSLELAKKLSDRGFSIHICSTPINLTFIKHKIPKHYASSIHLVELRLPELPELPSHYHTTNGLPLHLISTLRKALEMAKPSFSAIIEGLKPDLLVYDVLQPWAAEVAKDLDVPAVRFFTSGATACSYFTHLSIRPDVEFPFPQLCLRRYELEAARKLIEENKSRDKDEDEDSNPEFRYIDGNVIIISTSTEIEGKYVDYMAELLHTKIYSLGTLVQDPTVEGEGDDQDLIQWLETKPERSTVYVSFGSQYFLSKEEIEEVAYGLDQSHVDFIWVVRFPNGGEIPNLEDALPEGFVGRVGDRGRVVGGWAPQAKILSHPSIGGFVSHCGWNSMLESIEYGVPVIAMPIHLDQPINARLVVEIGVGVEVERDDNGRLHRESVGRVVGNVIRGNVGEDLRRNVKVVGENVRLKSLEEMDKATVVLEKICDRQEILNE